MPFHLRDVVGYLDATLEIERFRDYAPNGLQVEGAHEVERVVTGVSASAELIGRAIALHADLIVVHHGLIWHPGLGTITGPTARRLKLLLGNDCSLAAYHLPLDHHARLGNNTGLADALALGPQRDFFGDVRGIPLGLAGSWPQPLTRDEAIHRIAGVVLRGQAPRFVFPYGPELVRRVGVCTGAA
ncbi:MAG TPA: Nif3-like dinuclear metal center hexameric protein, partial [Kofleriaceae bacterium]